MATINFVVLFTLLKRYASYGFHELFRFLFLKCMSELKCQNKTQKP